MALLLLFALPAVLQADDFTYTTNNGALTITGYTGPGGDVTIPDSLNGMPVVAIGPPAFSNQLIVASVIIPNSVTNIGHSAFSECYRLTSATIGTNVINIGDYAFYKCTRLASANIPTGVTIIGNRAFYSCRLTSTTIPKSVTNVGIRAFSHCTSLTNITVDPLNLAYSSLDGDLFDKGQTTLIQCPGGKAGSYAISSNVTSIGNDAFYGCLSLTSITIPNSVTTIGTGAFGLCSDLTSITIPESVTAIGEGTFYYCTRMTSITIPNSVTNIGTYAFSYCRGLTNLTIPNSVATIGYAAFYYCSSLAEAYFRGNAPTTDPSVFDGSDNVTVYYLPGTTGWATTWSGRPTALWQPKIQTTDAAFGVQTNQFGFTIAWASNMVTVVEACTDLANPAWLPLQTNTLTADTLYFSDPDWTNFPRRFYRIRWP